MAIHNFLVKAYGEASSLLSGKHFKIAILYIKAYQKDIVTETQLKVALSALAEHENVLSDGSEHVADIIDYVEYHLNNDDYEDYANI